MSACKTLLCASLSSSFKCTYSLPSPPPTTFHLSSFLRRRHHHHHQPATWRFCHTSSQTVAASDSSSTEDEEETEEPQLQHLLTTADGVATLMKMDRKPLLLPHKPHTRWFPYLDRFRCGDGSTVTSAEVIDALAPCISEPRRLRFGNAVQNRSYGLCLVVEGLCDFGNVSASFRSADALGVQSVHVVSADANKRYKDNRHVSMGAEKWLDIELWDTTKGCFEMLKSRGYRIATTHLGMDAVSVYDLDWSHPTAIVVGNENRGITDEALELSDLHCSIPMNGMVDSFNVSVAAGILMHHAVCDRMSRMGRHGDLTEEERQILLAEFLLRHSKSAIKVVEGYAKRTTATLT